MVDEYMKKSLEAQLRSAAALESIAESLAAVARGGGAVGAGNARPASTAAVEAGTSQARAAASDASAKPAAPDAGNAAASTSTQASAQPAAGGSASSGKKITVDDVRAALKSYAAAQGNPSAMELLKSYGAVSVSTLPEDKWAEFVQKCGATK